MAGERTVSWQAVANFAQVTREAARAERALKSLKKAQQDFNFNQPGSSTSGVQDNRAQVSNLEKLAAANRTYASAKKAANKANADTVKTVRENVAGQASGYTLLAAALKETAKQRRALSRANATAVAAPIANPAREALNYEDLAKAKQKLAAATREATAAAKAESKAATSVSRPRASSGSAVSRPSAANATADSRAASQAKRDADALTVAQIRLTSALGQARVAALRLDEVKSKASAGSARLVSAEESYAASLRRVEQAAKKAGVSVPTALESISGTSRKAVDSTRQFGREVENNTRRVGFFGRALNKLRSDAGGAGNNINGVKSALGALLPEWRKNELSAYRFGTVLRASLVPLVITGINLLASLLSPLAAGFIGVAGAIAPVVGLLGTLPGLLAATAGGIVTLVAGFQGIFGALKAYEAMQKAVTSNNIKAGKAARTNANQQASSARTIRNAEEALADARRRQREQREDGARAIKDALENEKEAQKAVTEAREAARAEMDRMKKSLVDLALQEEGESLSLEEARQRLTQVMNDPGSTDLQRRQANLAVRQAENSLEGVRAEQAKTTDDLDKANKKGIEGSDQVVEAKKNEAKAHQAVLDAQANAARQNAASQRAVTDAVENLADANRQAKSNQDAYNDSLTQGNTQANAYADAMAKLTPEARAVVQQLIRMKPLIDGIRATAQRGMMPGVLSLLQDITKLAPLVDRFIGRAAVSFGRFFEQVGKALTTRSALDSWAKIFASTNTVIDDFLDIAFHVGRTIANIALAARPLTEWLVRSVRDWTRSWDAMTSGEAGQKRLQRFFRGTRTAASQLGRIIRNLFKTFYNLGKGASGTGRVILKAFEDMTERWAEFTGSVKGQNAIKKWAKDAEPALKQIAGLVGDFIKGIIDLGGQTDIAAIIQQIRTQLLPAVLRVFGLFTGETAAHIVSILSNIGDAIATISEANGGGLNDFFATLDAISGGIDSLVTNVPLARELIAGLIAVMATKAALSFASSLLGVSGAIKSVAGVSKGIKAFRAGRAAGSKKSAAKIAEESGAKRAAENAPLGTGKSKPKRAADTGPRRAAPGKAAPSTNTPRRAVDGPARSAGTVAPKGPVVTPKRAVGAAEDGAKGIGAVAKVLPKLGALAGIVQLVGLLGRGLAALGPIGAVVGALLLGLALMFGIVMLAIKGVQYGIKNFPGLWNPVIDVLKAVWNFIKLFAAGVVGLFQVFFQVIRNLFYVGWDVFRVLVVRPFQIGFKLLMGLVKNVAGMLAENFRRMVANVKFIWGLIVKYIIDPIIAFTSKGLNLLSNFGKATWATIKAIVRGIINFFNLQPVIDRVKGYIDTIKLIFKGLVKSITDTLKPVGDLVKTAFNKIRNAVGDPIGTVINMVNEGVIKPYISLADKFGITTKVKPIEYKIPKFQSGGTIPGVQSNVHRDNVLGVNSKGKAVARVEPGEFIMPRSKRKYFPLLEQIRQGKKVDGPLGGYKNGGELPRFKAGGYYQPIRGSISQGIHDGYTGFPALDYAAPVGNPVEAVADGRVSRSQDIKGAGNGGYRSYGRVIQVVSKGFETLYAHLSQRGVRVGQEVSAGQLIGKSGNTGNSTGPHLHFGAKNISPWTFNNGRFNFSGKLGAAGNSFVSNIASNLPSVAPFLMGLFDKASSLMNDIGGGEFGKMLTQVPKNLIKFAIDFATKNFNGGSDDAGSTDDTTSGSNQATGRRMMIAAGFSENQWGALKTLWQGESGWNERAKNPSSGAYGIPQALPASKMRSAGSDWLTNAATQIKWGLGYIKQVYGTPSNALSKWNARSPHWYARGTNQAQQGLTIVGEHGPEAIVTRGGEKVLNNNLTRRLPGYNAGGYVKSKATGKELREGASGDWVRALRSETHLGQSAKWTKALSDSLKKMITSVGTTSFGQYNKSTSLINAVVKYLKKQKKNKTIYQIGEALKLDQTTIWQNRSAIAAALKSQKASKGDQSYFGKTASNFGSARAKWLKSLEAQLGESQDGNWGQDSDEAVQHMLYHAFKMPHDDYLVHPWQAYTAAESAIMEQRRANKINAEFDKLVATFQNWNLTSLVRKMGELGPADGLALARDLSKSRSAATAYDKDLQDAYARSDAAGDTNSMPAKINLLVSVLKAGGATIGLQGAAQALSLSLDSTVGVYDAANSAGRLKGLSTKRIDQDVIDFRKLFKFATGGAVPGTGNNDSVHALLTPGEFVIRQGAAREIERRFGKGSLDYFNNIDRFATGGFVGGFSMPSYRGNTMSLSSATRSDTNNVNNTREVVNNFNTIVNNPTLEDGAVSVQKRVTKLAQLGLLRGND